MGFTCLDIIESKKQLTIGGTAGNVATILSMLGHEVYDFIPEYSHDGNSEIFYEMLNSRNIKVLPFMKTKKNVPKVIELLNTESGKHTFILTCPKCGKELMNSILPTESNVDKLHETFSEEFDVLFTDRMSKGIYQTAKDVQKNGGYTFYEPNACRTYKQLYEAVKEFDFVKFSNERISFKYAEMLQNDLKYDNTRLIINTMGKDGLVFCEKDSDNNWSKWKYLCPVKNPNLMDTAGAGDWLTAMFIYYYNEMKNDKAIGVILAKAQEAASFSCSYIGAQGIFYDQEGLNLFKHKFGIEVRERLVKKPYINYKLACSGCLDFVL